MNKCEIVLSDKLKKQMKALERNPKCVAFSQTLDEVFKRISKKRG